MVSKVERRGPIPPPPPPCLRVTFFYLMPPRVNIRSIVNVEYILLKLTNSKPKLNISNKQQIFKYWMKTRESLFTLPKLPKQIVTNNLFVITSGSILQNNLVTSERKAGGFFSLGKFLGILVFLVKHLNNTKLVVNSYI